MIDSLYTAFCGVEVTDEASFHPGFVCADGFERYRQQCRPEAGQRDNNFAILLLSPTLSSVVPLTSEANQ